MADDMALNQETDKRMGTSLDDGPPGVDGIDVTEKNEEATAHASRKGSKSKSTSRRRSISRRRSNSRHGASPPPMRRRRSHSRSPTPPPPPRRGRYDSPDYGRYPPRRRFDRRRSPDRDRDRRRSPPRRGRRDRYGRSRSRSRSNSPPRRGGGRGVSPSRWSPKKKPASPPLPAPSAQQLAQQQLPHPAQASGYGVMPTPMYAQGPYGAPDVYGHQYGMAPPNAFPPQGPPPGYGMQGPPPSQATGFNAGYGAWGVNEYGQQVWLPQTLANVPPAAPDALATQQVVLSAAGQLQQQQQLPQQTAIIEEQPPQPMALEGAGLPPQDAVAQEAENQKEELKKQRTNYVKKVSLLKKEIKVLKEQHDDLTAGDAPPSPTTKNFIEENDRLQVQIKKKLDTIENVIDMLNGIIGDEEADEEQETTPKNDPGVANSKTSQAVAKATSTTSDSSGESSDSSSSSSSSSDSSTDDEGDEENGDGSPTNRLKNRAIKSMKAKQRQAEIASKAAAPQTQSYNYIFFDSEKYWCESCSVFPKTARDYLKHLHAEEHMNRETMETPWHVGIDHDPFPTIDKAPVLRVPVRGLQFLVPASAWYCKLCSVWIGDLHCASLHLRSRTHANKYDLFMKKQPNYETEWLEKRERAQQQQKEGEEAKLKKAKKDEDKTSKKRKKKSGEKKKKKRKSKKHKRNANSTSSSTDSSTSDEADEGQQPKKVHATPDAPPNVALNAASIRVTMRKQESPAIVKPVTTLQVAPPPPPIIKDTLNMGERGKWTNASINEVKEEDQKRRDDAMMQQWNTVQPVISESEKKLLEQLKGKLKTKARPADDRKNAFADVDERSRRNISKRRSPSPRSGSRGRSDRDRRDRDRDRDRDRGRERERDRDRRRSRTRSRSRGRRRISRSPMRGGRRSRSRDARWRRSRSHSEERVERPVIKHSEFRPRTVPERKQNDSKRDKKDTATKPKPTKSSTSAATTAAAGGKKLPFIGKMPVLKKQAPAMTAGYNDAGVYTNGGTMDGITVAPPPPPPPPQMTMTPAVRQNAPTAAQIQMAMMEDAFGNAPPFHPDAGMMMDYDELMPDPVQFANLMTHCPPPPPPGQSTNADGKESLDTDQLADDDNGEEDVLPPGIDEVETEDLLPQPLVAGSQTEDGELPKDLAEALNIIFPADRPAEEGSVDNQVPALPQTITTIVEDEPVLDEHNLQDLASQGIHLVSIGETTTSPIPALAINDAAKSVDSPMQISADEASQGACSQQVNGNDTDKSMLAHTISLKQMPAQDIPMPCSPPAEPIADIKAKVSELLDVANIPQPPPSPTESEKLRRQAELDELAMLGIDSDDMAAQYAL